MKLTRRLWTETPSFRKERWIRFGFLSPVAAFAGGLWGNLAGGVESIFPGIGLFLAGAYLYTRTHPALVQWAEARRRGGGRLAAFFFDVVVVGGGGLLLTRGLGFPWSPAVGTALAMGGGAAMGFAWLFGHGSSGMFQAVLSPAGRSGRRPPAVSHIEARMAKGDFQGAREAWEELLDRHPREADAWVSLARLLAGPLGEPDEALRCLEEGLHLVRGDAAAEARLLRQVVLLHQGRDEPLLAVPLLARYAERWGDTAEGEWARETRLRLRREHLTDVED